MMEQPFHVEVRPFIHGLILDLQGDLTKQAEEYLLKLRKWEEGLEPGHKYLILNFTRSPYINSAGIALLIRLVRSGRNNGFQTFGYGVTSHYMKMFRMVGLTEYMSIYPDEYAVLTRIEMLEA